MFTGPWSFACDGLVRLNIEDDCWTETSDLKTVTGLTSITSCFLGSWSILLVKCLFLCYYFSFYVCQIVHFSLIKKNIQRVRTYCISVTFSDWKYLSQCFPPICLFKNDLIQFKKLGMLEFPRPTICFKHCSWKLFSLFSY